jgi:universal stress protein A
MNGWKNICCAVDFSEHSRAAFRRAVELCHLLEAELTLLHVSTPNFPGGDVLFARGEPADQLAEGPLQARLDTWREEAEHELGRAVHVEFLAGNAAREIAQYSRRGTDILVVGTRGPSGLGRLLLGSVAEKVVRDAACPVLVVHRTEAAAQEPRATTP